MEFGDFFEAISDAVIVQDRSGRFVYANEAGLRSLGVKSVDALASRPASDYADAYEMFTEDGAPLSSEQVPGKLVLKDGQPRKMTMRFLLRGTGEERWAEISSSPLPKGPGAPAYAVTLYKDITQERRAVQARDDVLAIVSHDLRNPLSAIGMNAFFLRSHAPAQVGGVRIHERVESIQRSVDRMTRLISDLLDAAKIESGLMPLTLREHAASAVLLEAVELMRPLASSRLQRLELSEEKPGLRVRCDLDRVIQVLSNLIGNAIKFGPESGGMITLATGSHGGMAVFSVRDQGPGIPPDAMARIFERFWRASHAGREGAGLGLYIARGIVEAHGGRIWAESEPGKGAAFHFTVPLA